MRLLLCLIIITLGNLTTSLAQELTQTIRGKISDSESEMTLPGATIAITSMNPIIGAISDMNGNFAIDNIPVGRHSIKITFVGYQEVVLQNILVSTGKEVVLNISMQENFVQMNEVVIKAKTDVHATNNDMTSVSARSFSVEEASRYAASIDDPARMAQSFAGVATTDDVSNEIVVRGNSPRGLLWRLNGIEIPSPNHFSDEGTSGGGVSVLSNNMLDNSDFLTGAFPAEYGNALSGVFDVKLRKGNNQKKEYAAQIGVLGTDFSAEGPFTKNKRASYLVNYRYSTLGLLTNLKILDIGGTNTFQDLAFNLNFPTKKAGIFTVFGIGGLSKSGDILEKDTSLWETSEANYIGEFNSNMGVAGVTHQYFFNNSTYLKTIVANTIQEINFYEDSVSAIDLKTNRTHTETFVNSNYRINTYINSKLNNKNTIRTGIIGGLLQYDLNQQMLMANQTWQTNLDKKGATTSFQSYAQWKHKFSEKLTLNTGVHFFRLSLTKANSLEPRLGLNYKLAANQTLSAGFGIHSRMESISVYELSFPNKNDVVKSWNNNLGFSKSNHYVLGYDIQLKKQKHIKVEAYYQSLYHLPIASDSSSSYALINQSGGFANEPLINKGTGYNVGTEVTFEKYLSNQSYYMLTASIFDSKFADINNQLYNTRYNANYRITVLGGKEYAIGNAQKNLLEFNGKFIWSGGNRYTPIDLPASIAGGRQVNDNNQLFAEKVPDYWRFDVTVNYRVNNAKVAHVVSINIQNVSNRINLFGYQYNNKTKQIEEIDQFGLLPVLKYRIEF